MAETTERSRTLEWQASVQYVMDTLTDGTLPGAALVAKSKPDPPSAATLAGFADYIRVNKCSKIVVMIGAGVSTAAGIPDFRSENGLYHTIERYLGPLEADTHALRLFPERVFSAALYRQDPHPFYAVSAALMHPTRPDGSPSPIPRPTCAHDFIEALAGANLLLKCYTQNIDGLELAAGVPRDKIVAAHGSFDRGACTKCGRPCDGTELRDGLSRYRDTQLLPTCGVLQCDGLMKPSVVLFGEPLPAEFQDNYAADFAQADMLIIMGTSLTVYPFANLVRKPKRRVPRLILNDTMVGDGRDSLIFEGNRGLRIGFSTRHALIEGDLQTSTATLWQLLKDRSILPTRVPE